MSTNLQVSIKNASNTCLFINLELSLLTRGQTLNLYILQEITWGPEDGVPSNSVALAPDSTVSLSFQNCQKVEILTQTFNSVPLLQNVSIQNIEEFTIHSRIYESRIGSGQSATISNFKIVNVSLQK